MEIRNIRSFIKTAELGNITRAAESLGYAQSTITSQIHQLESELQVHLFNRHGKKLSLSSAGSEFLHYAYQIIKYETNAINHFTQTHTPKGMLQIGIMETICTSDYSQIFQDFSSAYPDISLSIQILTATEALEGLSKSTLDVIFTLDHKITNSNLITHHEKPVNISFFCCSSHPLAYMEEIYLEQLLHDSFILTEKGCNYRDLFESELRLRKLKLHLTSEIGHSRYIIEAVSKQLVIGLLPEFILQEEIKKGKIIILPVTDYQIHLFIQVLYSSKHPITPALYAFLKFSSNKLQHKTL